MGALMTTYRILVELTGGAHHIITEVEEDANTALRKWTERRYFSRPLFIWPADTNVVTQVMSREEYYTT